MNFKCFIDSCAMSLTLVLLITVPYLGAQAQSPTDDIDARADTAELANKLGSPDPLLRQRSAEALAQLVAMDQRKVVEGYQLQEKNKEVRLALDWALYRMGRSEALFRIVRELDSGRQEQAVGYLSQLESPEMLYPYLKRDNNAARINAGILKALGKIGDADTLQVIEPYRESLQAHVAEAAESAHDELEKRLGQSESPTRVRPRTVAKP